MKFDVLGISNWPESPGEQFPIFISKEFENELAARVAAYACYNESLEVIVLPSATS